MPLKLPYMFTSAKDKRQIMIDTALQDSFFKPIIHELIDYGYEVTFPMFGGAGAYQPHALTTEALDTPEKQLMFTHGFAHEVEQGTFKSKIKLTSWFGRGGNVHSFLHEVMHFYQDTLGLYLLPLKEQGVMPVMADLRTSVVALLFCEAWAQVEALRTCWSLKHKEIDDRPWKGAMSSPDWGELAKFYNECMEENRGEARAAALTFEKWYVGKHRAFYENHALALYDLELKRLTSDVADSLKEGDAITDHLRGSDLKEILLKIPKEAIPHYFDKIDWEDELFNEPKNEFILNRCKEGDLSQNENIHDVRVASPPYLWKRLRDAEIEASEVPPQSTMEFEHSGGPDKQVGDVG